MDEDAWPRAWHTQERGREVRSSGFQGAEREHERGCGSTPPGREELPGEGTFDVGLGR